MALTDKKAIRVALEIAIDYEESLIEARRNDFTGKVTEDDEGVKIARRRIAAFKRVLDRYYPNDRRADPFRGAKAISIMDIVASLDAA